MAPGRLLSMVGALVVLAVACSDPTGEPINAAGSAGTGGTAQAGGGSGSGGNPGTGGSGGTGATGGTSGSAGTGGTSGSAGTGGTSGSAGTGGTSGSAGTGGTSGSAGTGGSGGSAGRGTGGSSGATGTGGSVDAGSGGSAGRDAGGTGGGSTDAGGDARNPPPVTSDGGVIPLKNPPVKSAGCDKPTTVTNGKKTITSTNQQRTYIIDIPTNYDMSKPYRFFYTSHWIGAKSEDVQGQNYYFLKPLANAANEPAIFVAPQSDGSTWQEKDHALFDDILKYVKENLCIDTTRVFATGFSFGGMITYSLSVNHQKDIRAAVGIAPANYNIFVPSPKSHAPIAWMQTTGMSDGTCPWIQGSSTTQGSKFIAIERGTDNGCAVPATIPIWTSGAHVCYDMPSCRPEFPTKVCTFNGPHTNIAMDPGSSANWIPTESWKFFTQF